LQCSPGGKINRSSEEVCQHLAHIHEWHEAETAIVDIREQVDVGLLASFVARGGAVEERAVTPWLRISEAWA
jgi:hypothetical protein